jgi:UDP-N-acetylglucosamine--N-acetylmuramyl-(pentapeptide) pyrophosphoryl-undecaprenol N-acetylglucosamine transferase
MAANGAAIHLPQSELEPSRLADLLRSLTRDRLLAMAVAARSVGKPDATKTVASIIEKVAA